MQENKMRCMKCLGRKKIYAIGNGYCLINSGGVEVNCPLCLGEGVIDTLEEATKKIAEKKKETDKKRDYKKGDATNADASA